MEDELYVSITQNVRKPTKHKTALFLCGASGVGKTKYRNTFLKDVKFTSSYVYLNLDDIVAAIKDRNKSRVLLESLLNRTIQDGYSIFLDATCRNYTYISNTITLLKNKEYRIIFGLMYAPLTVVLDRVQKRIDQPSTETIVKDIYTHLSKNAEKYMSLDELDEMYLYNNEQTSVLMFKKKDKMIKCITPNLDFYFDVSKYC